MSHRIGLFRPLVSDGPARVGGHRLLTPLAAALGLLLATSPLAAQTAPPTSGLILWLKADAGVTADPNGLVSDWEDQSPEGNHAGTLSPDYGPEGTELPQLVADVVNGRPVIRFDGVDDVLEIPNRPSLQPGEGGWTVVFVGRRLDGSRGDFPQIIGSRPWLTGLDAGWSVSMDNTGRPASHFADGSAGHDVPQVRAMAVWSDSSFETWLVEEDRAAQTTSFYRQGDLDSILATAMPTAPVIQDNPVHLGREIGGANNRRAAMELAEVLVYNTVLTPTDRLAVITYLSERYDLRFTVNLPPTVALTEPAPGSSVAAPADLTLNATASDPDGSIARVEFFEGSSLVGTAFAPPYRLPVRVLAPAELSFVAVAVDDRGERVASAPVAVTATGSPPGDLAVQDGLRLWLKADAGVTADAGGQVSGWEDQSSEGNHAGPLGPDYGPLGTEAPLLVPGEGGGRPVIRFDGEDDVLEIANSPSLLPGAGDWTVIFVAQRRTPSQGDFPQIIGSRPWLAGLDAGWAVSYGTDGRLGSHFADGTVGHDVPQIRSTSPVATDELQIWQVEEDRTGGATRFYLGGNVDAALTPSMPVDEVNPLEPIHLGREMGGANNRRAHLDLAEVLVFNRVLSAEERTSVTVYLGGRYDLPVLTVENQPPTVTLTAPSEGAEIIIPAPVTLTATAADADGSVVRVEFFAGLRSLGVATTAPFTLTTTELPAGDLTLTARATDNLGAVTTSASVSVKAVIPNPPQPLTLIGVLDYSDSFTVGPAGPPTTDNPRPNGMYNDHSFGGYDVAETHGNPPAQWTPTANFSFNTPGNSTGPAITEAALGNDGAATGFAQSGGGDFNFTYGLRTSYVVQVDALLPLDRLDIGSYGAAGDGVGTAPNLTVFFRRDTSSAPGIGLYNGVREVAVTGPDGSPAQTGIIDNDWHNFGVHFDQAENRLGLYVDGFLKATVDLTTFADGEFANFPNGAVGVGGAGFNGTHAQWFDNFQVGQPALVGVADYSDSFTVGPAGAPTADNPRPNGMYNDHSFGGYNVAETHGNPPAQWVPTANFSFNTPGNSTGPAITEAALGNDGAATGFAQSGGGDFSLAYGLRDDFVVQVDAILPLDRLDLRSLAEPGQPLSAANSLSVFLRRDSATGPGIGLYDGSVETAVTDTGGAPLSLGIDDAHWHTFAARFDRSGKRLSVFADGVTKAVIDLTVFADGRYATFGNGAVGIGGAGFDGTQAQWFDNFVVGQPGPAAGPATTTAAPPTLSVRLDGEEIVLEWTGEGTLERAGDLEADWEPVPDAASPLRVTPSLPQQYFRLTP